MAPAFRDREGLLMGVRTVGTLVWRTLGRFIDEGAMRHGAGLAFYSTLSLAPLVLLALSVVTLLPREGMEALVVDQLPLLVGDRGAEVAAQVLANAPERAEGMAGVLWGLALLVFGASMLFVNVKETLDELWGVLPPERGIVQGFLRARFSAVLMMLATGVVFVASVALGAVAAWITPVVEHRLPVGATVVTLLELATSGVILTLLCAATYRILPAADISWRDVWLGAGLTAVLFLLGRALIGWYLAHAAVVSQFGAAGSLVVFLMWVYYSAQIFLLGAEFTQVYAEARGRPIRPVPGARRVERRVEPYPSE
jgi:membrane protein